MLNNTLFSATAIVQQYYLAGKNALTMRLGGKSVAYKLFFASAFLVSVPVFIQAPLVRLFPWLSLCLTGVWVWVALSLRSQDKTYIWGDLLLGFSWSWLAGSIYWGWFKDQPLIHIPIEAIALPFALWCIWRGKGLIGNLFYLGSLLGTAITDLYFWIVGLIPYWREVMQVNPELVAPILQRAIADVQTPWGISWAIVLANLLLAIGLWSLQKPNIYWWGFAGAVLSTILVDSLFWLAAFFA